MNPVKGLKPGNKLISGMLDFVGLMVLSLSKILNKCDFSSQIM